MHYTIIRFTEVGSSRLAILKFLYTWLLGSEIFLRAFLWKLTVKTVVLALCGRGSEVGFDQTSTWK